MALQASAPSITPHTDGIKHLESLDGIRGLACLMVFYCHLEYSPYMPYTTLPLNFGFLGVLLFFILSGFLMGYLYMETQSPRKILHYLVKRFFRIYPLFVVASVAGIIIAQTVGFYSLARFHLNKTGFDFEYLIAQLLLQKGWAGLWTIPVEMHFYALFAGMLIVSMYSLRLRILMFFLGAVALLYCADLPANAQELRKYIEKTSYFYMWNFMGIFLYGVCFGVIHRKHTPHTSLQSVMSSFANIATFAMLVVLVLGPISSLFPDTLWHLDWEDAVWLSPIMGFYILSCAGANNAKAQIINNPFLCYTGKISYSLYVWHIIILFIKIPHHPFEQHIMLVLMVCIIYAVSTLSYRFIEKPAIKFAAKML